MDNTSPEGPACPAHTPPNTKQFKCLLYVTKFVNPTTCSSSSRTSDSLRPQGL